MKRKALKALSWGHRRATGPLAPLSQRFAEKHPGIAIEWIERPLSGFEHQPIGEVARKFDLIIYDHPFSGDVATERALLRLDDEMPDLLGPDADRRYVGASLPSYRYDGQVFGAPIDAATQHAILRRDLLQQAGGAAPQNWSEVIALGGRLRGQGLHLGLAVVSPHAGLAAAALMSNRGRPWSAQVGGGLSIDIDALQEALESIRELLDFCPADVLGWNSIDLHEAMLARDDLAYAPCVYGYATYGETDMRRLAFGDFPGPAKPFAAGTAIGGTALGVSAFTQEPEAALAFIRFALSREAQCDIIPAHHGQPALVDAWDDAATNERFNGYFRDVRATIDQAWVRPRAPGYIGFQRDAGLEVERYLRREIGLDDAVSRILTRAERVGTAAEFVP